MKLAIPGAPHLTYCTNIHAGENWQDIRASLDEHVPAIKSTAAPNQPMGVGLRLSGEAAAVARAPEALASFAAVLVTSTGVPPAASTTKMSYCSMLLPWYAIFVPSGDHAGCSSMPASLVSRVTPVPSMFIT